jgi:signal transduction histidine kinase
VRKWNAMTALARQDAKAGTRRALALPALSSLLVITVLALALADAPAIVLSGLASPRALAAVLLAAIVPTGAAIAGLAIRTARARAVRAERELAALRRSAATANAIVKAEPQVLVLWEPGGGPEVVAHSLVSVAGVPQGRAELARFGAWLASHSADELKAALDRLFDGGRPFNLLLRTAAGDYLEADGRASGARAILRLRDVAGHKGDLVRIIDQHRQLAADIRKCRQLLDALPLPVWMRGRDGRLEWINQAYVKAVEARDGNEVLQGQLELLESRQRGAVDQTLATRQPYTERISLITGGERKPHDVIALPIDGASAAAAIDVAALERARGELDRLVAAYDRTLHRVATAIAIFGPDQHLTFFNEAYARLWQLDPDWLATGPSDGQILDRLRQDGRLPIVGEYRPWKEKVLAGYRTGEAYEDWWHLPDGRMVHVATEQRPDRGVTYLYDDESERFALESRYNALIHVQRETLDSLKEGVAVFATDGRLKLFNSALLQIWKLARQVLEMEPHVAEIIRQARTLYEDAATWSQITRAVTSLVDERAPIEGRMVRPDQSVIDFAVTPLPDGATLVTFADVTDNKRYERALLERNEALVAADRLKSNFLSHVSYELRTPLTSIIGFTEMLASPIAGSLNARQQEYLDDITVSSRKLLTIIDDILDQATIDAGALELKLAPVKVRALIDAAVLGVRDRAARGDLTIDVAIADDAEELIADESRVRQILYNLLSNAIGFSRPGDTIRVSCWSDGPMMAFSIEDQGVGIPKEQQRHIFERFESRSQGSRHRGAGLGLSIVKSLVELHGGEMLLESEPGRGTRVTVRLPETGMRPAAFQASDAQTETARLRA